MRVKYDVDTQLIFQIGDPIDHSTAAFLHNEMYDLANINAVCVPILVKKGTLPEFTEAVRRLNLNGFDITMPHKSDIIPLLDECDETSRLFNSVNHVKNENGKLIGIGLDGVGMGSAIAEKAGSLKGKKVLLLGAGSVAGPIGADLCQRGVSEVFVANRTVEKAKKTAQTIGDYFGVKTGYGELTEEYLAGAASQADLVVQCTSLGMAGSAQQYQSLRFMERLHKDVLCADVLYPNTAFLDRAKALGLPVLNGLGMLLNQQIAMIEFRFGIKLPQKCLLQAEEALACAVTLRDLRDQRRGGMA
ncbi:MAG: shikimate dehydrogenase [Eubacterium sp.]|jgi:shikimate dehydrogenase|nr:shikimate dehydrogenase [Eubacterium sp.]